MKGEDNMKPITFEPFRDTLREKLDAQFNDFLSEKHCNATATFRVDIADLFKDIPKARVVFMAAAYLKMILLTQQSDKELAAHGTVRRDGNLFVVEDLHMYPQHVTSVTVKASDEYGPWLHELSDEVFNKLRFQFHSHVNMPTTPSSTDDDWYKDMLKDVTDFYIFMVFNKRGERWLNIYDIEHNLIYENTDIIMDVCFDDGVMASDWLDESFLLIDTRTYTEAKTASFVKSKESAEDKRNKVQDAAKKNQQHRKPGRPKESQNKPHIRMTPLNDDTPLAKGSTAADDYRGGKLATKSANCFYFQYPTAKECDKCLDTYGYHPCCYGRLSDCYD
jgi:hypothetical protein